LYKKSSFILWDQTILDEYNKNGNFSYYFKFWAITYLYRLFDHPLTILFEVYLGIFNDNLWNSIFQQNLSFSLFNRTDRYAFWSLKWHKFINWILILNVHSLCKWDSLSFAFFSFFIMPVSSFHALTNNTITTTIPTRHSAKGICISKK